MDTHMFWMLYLLSSPKTWSWENLGYLNITFALIGFTIPSPLLKKPVYQNPQPWIQLHYHPELCWCLLSHSLEWLRKTVHRVTSWWSTCLAQLTMNAWNAPIPIFFPSRVHKRYPLPVQLNTGLSLFQTSSSFLVLLTDCRDMRLRKCKLSSKGFSAKDSSVPLGRSSPAGSQERWKTTLLLWLSHSEQAKDSELLPNSHNWRPEWQNTGFKHLLYHWFMVYVPWNSNLWARHSQDCFQNSIRSFRVPGGFFWTNKRPCNLPEPDEILSWTPQLCLCLPSWHSHLL